MCGCVFECLNRVSEHVDVCIFIWTFICMPLFTCVYICLDVSDLLCLRSGPSEEEDNYVPFAVMSGCLLIVMHTVPEGLRGPVTYTVYLSHTQVWWSTWCHRGQTELISCHCLWTSSLFSFPPFAQNTIMPLLHCIQRGRLLLYVFSLQVHLRQWRSSSLQQSSKMYRSFEADTKLHIYC